MTNLKGEGNNYFLLSMAPYHIWSYVIYVTIRDIIRDIRAIGIDVFSTQALKLYERI